MEFNDRQVKVIDAVNTLITIAAMLIFLFFFFFFRSLDRQTREFNYQIGKDNVVTSSG